MGRPWSAHIRGQRNETIQMSEHMRTLTAHQTNECNRAIRVTADDVDPDNGNASHVYDVAVGTGPDGHQLHHFRLLFQHGPIKEVGTNGITHEVLIAILIDRLECFQTGKFANEYNAQALRYLCSARATLLARTQERLDRNVEGTHQL